MTDPRKKILRMILGLTLYAVVGFLTARWFNWELVVVFLLWITAHNMEESSK